jgi:hypothetical protein
LICSELISYHAPQKKQDAFLACSIWMLTLVHVNICPLLSFIRIILFVAILWAVSAQKGAATSSVRLVTVLRPELAAASRCAGEAVGVG